MSRIAPRWWWLTLASRPAKLAPIAALGGVWAAFLAGWVDIAVLYASCAVALAAVVLACTAHAALIVRRALIRTGRRWA
ncbi:hypothetical protein [Nocardia neocaledoniensis]|uniref:hypothetical protein n=1 Tax=Nocardia neocaledoniensis TaxID=236511 RepID=UPI0024575397|nr:hypothetical protein [Nocardia neocaledoniensis]